jgi:ferric-chelate reductase
VVRAHAGFSRRLYNRATSCLPTTSSPRTEISFPVILDGPYGRPPNFLQYDTLVLIAGSTGVTFTIPILMHALQSREASCVRRIQFVWIVKSGAHFEWFAKDIERALDMAEEKGVSLDVRGYVTCEPSYTTNFPIRHPTTTKKEAGGCCCCQQLDESPSEIQEITTSTDSVTTNTPVPTNEKGTTSDEKVHLADEISLASDSSSEQMCKCNGSAGTEESPISIATGRPDLRSILDRNLTLARGETGVAVCGPQGLMARTRCVVAELSDLRGSEKGTGAHGVALFGEGFGW